jgi:tRNA(Arg) A34 adenosine deaminase TadA
VSRDTKLVAEDGEALWARVSIKEAKRQSEDQELRGFPVGAVVVRDTKVCRGGVSSLGF